MLRHHDVFVKRFCTFCSTWNGKYPRHPHGYQLEQMLKSRRPSVCAHSPSTDGRRPTGEQARRGRRRRHGRRRRSALANFRDASACGDIDDGALGPANRPNLLTIDRWLNLPHIVADPLTEKRAHHPLTTQLHGSRINPAPLIVTTANASRLDAPRRIGHRNRLHQLGIGRRSVHQPRDLGHPIRDVAARRTRAHALRLPRRTAALRSTLHLGIRLIKPCIKAMPDVARASQTAENQDTRQDRRPWNPLDTLCVQLRRLVKPEHSRRRLVPHTFRNLPRARIIRRATSTLPEKKPRPIGSRVHVIVPIDQLTHCRVNQARMLRHQDHVHANMPASAESRHVIRNARPHRPPRIHALRLIHHEQASSGQPEIRQPESRIFLAHPHLAPFSERRRRLMLYLQIRNPLHQHTTAPNLPQPIHHKRGFPRSGSTRDQCQPLRDPSMPHGEMPGSNPRRTAA